MALTHFRRAINLNIKEIDSSDDRLFPKYLKWRKCAAVCAIFPCFMSACLEAVAMARLLEADSNTLREKTSIVFPRLDSIVLLGLSAYCVYTKDFTCANIIVSRFLWTVAFILPLFAPVFLGNAIDWPEYSTMVIPLALTLPYAINRASLRTCLLGAESHASFGILVLFLPVYSLLVFLSILPIHNECNGPGSLTAAMVFLASSPWIYLTAKDAYLRPEGKETARKRTEIIVGFVNFLGGFCMAGFGFNEENIPAREVFQLLFECIGRSFSTNILVTDGLIQLMATSWLEDDDSECSDTLFSPFCEAIYSEKGRTKTVKSSPPRKLLKPSPKKDGVKKTIGMHDIFRESVVDMEPAESTSPKKIKKEDARRPYSSRDTGTYGTDFKKDVRLSKDSREIKHEVFDMDIETGAPGGDEEDFEDSDEVLKMMKDLEDALAASA